MIRCGAFCMAQKGNYRPKHGNKKRNRPLTRRHTGGGPSRDESLAIQRGQRDGERLQRRDGRGKVNVENVAVDLAKHKVERVNVGLVDELEILLARQFDVGLKVECVCLDRCGTKFAENETRKNG